MSRRGGVARSGSADGRGTGLGRRSASPLRLLVLAQRVLCRRIGSQRSAASAGRRAASRPQADRMYDLWIGSVIAALVVGVFVWGLIFWCVIRYRKRGDELPVQTRFNMPMEFLYTIAPFLIVSVLFYYTAIVQTDVDQTVAEPRRDRRGRRRSSGTGSSTTATARPRAPDRPDGHVHARHHRVHPGAGAADRPDDPVRGDQPTTSSTRSGCRSCCSSATCSRATSRNVFEVTIDQEGAYVGRCAELCGTYHSMMNFELRAVSPDKYDQFLAAKQAGKIDAGGARSRSARTRWRSTTPAVHHRRDASNFEPGRRRRRRGKLRSRHEDRMASCSASSRPSCSSPPSSTRSGRNGAADGRRRVGRHDRADRCRFLLCAMCGGFFWFVARRIEPRPEDRAGRRDRRRRRRDRLLQPGQLLAVRHRAGRHDRRPRPGLLAVAG